MHLTYHDSDTHTGTVSTAKAGETGAPETTKWLDLLADEAAIDRMVCHLMERVSEEIDALSIPSPERARDLIEDLILAAAGKPSLVP